MLQLALLSSLLLANPLNPPAQGILGGSCLRLRPRSLFKSSGPSMGTKTSPVMSCRGSSKEDHLCLETEPVQGPDTRPSASECQVLEGQLLDQYPFAIDKIREQS